MMRTATLIFLVTWSAVVQGSSEPQREALLFAKADHDSDGQITKDDLQTIFMDFDSNKDGTITEAEFVADWTSVYHLGNANEARTLFTKADTNADGVITSADLSDIYAFFDMDGDNMVDLNEFLTQWHDLRLTAPDTIVIGTDGN